MDLEITHQSVHDYIAAKKRGDQATTDRIVREATARCDSSELTELGRAMERVTVGKDL